MTEKQKAVMELRLQGLCGSEIADRLGYSTKAVASLAKQVGLPFTDEERARSQELGHQKRLLSENELERIVEKHAVQFEYIGGYSGSEGTLRIRCKACGTETERSIISIRHNTVKCGVCARTETEARKEIREAARKAEAKRRRSEAKAKREEDRLKKLWDMEPEQQVFTTCVVCGNVFMAKTKRTKTCGADCLRRLSNAKRKDRRIRKIKSLAVDKDITLEGLYRRDNGTCYLCGVECDWNNMAEREDGTRIAGDWYPSIDHVMPLSKGGLHSWDNVRLAHRICNYLKKDKGYSSPVKGA